MIRFKILVYFFFSVFLFSCEPDEVDPPIKANFSFSGTPCEAPCEITFTNLSTGNIDAYAWSFGDGVSFSTDENPVFTYANDGVFTVGLVVTGGGQTADTSMNVMINPSEPVASFSVQNDSCIAPCAVTFTNTSMGSSLTYSWDFGDGTPASTDENPVHTYTSEGSYTVILTATGQGASDDTAQIVTIRREPPIADFTVQNDNCTVPCSVSFMSTSTGTVDSLRWDFGDGNSSAEQNPVHEYVDFGQYTVTLTAFGGMDSDMKSKSVTLLEPRTPVDTVSGTLFNQAGPAGTGGINLITGASQSWLATDSHLRDAGIDLNQVPSTNWLQMIRGANGSTLKTPASGFDFEQTETKEQIRRAYEAGQAISNSNTIQTGDVFLIFNTSISTFNSYFAIRVETVNVTTTDNSDSYTFSIKY